MAWIKSSIMFITILVTIISMSRVQAREININGGNITRNDENIDGLFESITNITGNILCLFHHHNSSIAVANGPVHPPRANGTAPPFSNAVVELKCGANLTLATAITDIEGLFTMMINPLQAILSTILSDCTLTVATPLTACNPNASPSGGHLSSPLQFIEHIIRGLLKIAIVIPVGFDIRVGG